MVELKEGWPEITYKYIEYYFWEPQHLIRTKNSIAKAKARGISRVQVVHENLHKHEVPLNYLLNVLLRILPSSFRHQLLKPFGIDLNDPGLKALVLQTPCEREYIQPDIHLESDSSRVFIELKVNAQLTLEQIEKYVQFHNELNTERSKQSYVLFLVKNDKLKLHDIKKEYDHRDVGQNLPLLLQENDGIVFGSTTWKMFSDNLSIEYKQRCGEHPDYDEMLHTLVGDFLSDLKERRHMI